MMSPATNANRSQTQSRAAHAPSRRVDVHGEPSTSLYPSTPLLSHAPSLNSTRHPHLPATSSTHPTRITDGPCSSRQTPTRHITTPSPRQGGSVVE
jgi:hypothetical protein